ncbi:hypothetical protein BN439_0402 [Erwinia amylovora Ea644]|nr:hypothetical protein BN439_0402 [Erwinia amylovora Ea644]CCP05489.1 hypothetical protein BN440_0436 [Erwinia amylovora MR1]
MAFFIALSGMPAGDSGENVACYAYRSLHLTCNQMEM